MARVIEVIVSPRGETTVQTKGYAGGDCLLASKFLEQALGIATAEHKSTEYFQSTPAEQHVRQQASSRRPGHQRATPRA